MTSSPAAQRILHAVKIAAPLAKVREALATAEGLRGWWSTRVETSGDPGHDPVTKIRAALVVKKKTGGTGGKSQDLTLCMNAHLARDVLGSETQCVVPFVGEFAGGNRNALKGIAGHQPIDATATWSDGADLNLFIPAWHSNCNRTQTLSALWGQAGYSPANYSEANLMGGSAFSSANTLVGKCYRRPVYRVGGTSFSQDTELEPNDTNAARLTAAGVARPLATNRVGPTRTSSVPRTPSE